jgi:hypothetical protein
MGVLLSVAVYTAGASGFCRTVGGQAGVPFDTKDWASGYWKYSWDSVVNVSNYNRFWQIALPLDEIAGTYQVTANYGIATYPIADPLMGADFAVLRSDGTWYGETGYRYTQQILLAPAAWVVGSMWIPNDATLMASFYTPPAGQIVQVSYCTQ